MQTIYIKNIKEILKNKKELEEKLKTSLAVKGKVVSFESDAIDEFQALRVLEAIAFGFSARKSLSLLDEEKMFRKVHIKSHTKRKLKDIQARLIGTHGKTKKIISDISGCDIVVTDGDVGILGDAETIYDTETAIVSLIKGSKQSNMYRYLERRNKERKSLY